MNNKNGSNNNNNNNYGRSTTIFCPAQVEGSYGPMTITGLTSKKHTYVFNKLGLVIFSCSSPISNAAQNSLYGLHNSAHYKTRLQKVKTST